MLNSYPISRSEAKNHCFLCVWVWVEASQAGWRRPERRPSPLWPPNRNSRASDRSLSGVRAVDRCSTVGSLLWRSVEYHKCVTLNANSFQMQILFFNLEKISRIIKQQLRWSLISVPRSGWHRDYGRASRTTLSLRPVFASESRTDGEWDQSIDRRKGIVDCRVRYSGGSTDAKALPSSSSDTSRDSRSLSMNHWSLERSFHLIINGTANCFSSSIRAVQGYWVNQHATLAFLAFYLASWRKIRTIYKQNKRSQEVRHRLSTCFVRWIAFNISY